MTAVGDKIDLSNLGSNNASSGGNGSDWRDQYTSEVRENLVRLLYDQLCRVSGEPDRNKVWGAAANFEHRLYLECTKSMEYEARLRKKLDDLAARPAQGSTGQTTGNATPGANTSTSQAPSSTQSNSQAVASMQQAQAVKREENRKLQERDAASAGFSNNASVGQKRDRNAASVPGTPNSQSPAGAGRPSIPMNTSGMTPQQQLQLKLFQQQQASLMGQAGLVAPGTPMSRALQQQQHLVGNPQEMTNLYWNTLFKLKQLYLHNLQFMLNEFQRVSGRVGDDPVKAAKVQALLQNLIGMINLLQEHPGTYQPRSVEYLNKCNTYIKENFLPLILKMKEKYLSLVEAGNPALALSQSLGSNPNQLLQATLTQPQPGLPGASLPMALSGQPTQPQVSLAGFPMASAAMAAQNAAVASAQQMLERRNSIGSAQQSQAAGLGGQRMTPAQAQQQNEGLQRQQQRLLALIHARSCTAPEGQCSSFNHCGALKSLWAHISVCHDPKCEFTHCLSSRYVIVHYSQCQNPACIVCQRARQYELFQRTGVQAGVGTQGMGGAAAMQNALASQMAQQQQKINQQQAAQQKLNQQQMAQHLAQQQKLQQQINQAQQQLNQQQSQINQQQIKQAQQQLNQQKAAQQQKLGEQQQQQQQEAAQRLAVAQQQQQQKAQQQVKAQQQQLQKQRQQSPLHRPMAAPDSKPAVKTNPLTGAQEPVRNHKPAPSTKQMDNRLKTEDRNSGSKSTAETPTGKATPGNKQGIAKGSTSTKQPSKSTPAQQRGSQQQKGSGQLQRVNSSQKVTAVTQKSTSKSTATSAKPPAAVSSKTGKKATPAKATPAKSAAATKLAKQASGGSKKASQSAKTTPKATATSKKQEKATPKSQAASVSAAKASAKASSSASGSNSSSASAAASSAPAGKTDTPKTQQESKEAPSLNLLDEIELNIQTRDGDLEWEGESVEDMLALAVDYDSGLAFGGDDGVFPDSLADELGVRSSDALLDFGSVDGM